MSATPGWEAMEALRLKRLAKLTLNSTYGKAQREERRESPVHADAPCKGQHCAECAPVGFGRQVVHS
jgi:hypothetical protein